MSEQTADQVEETTEENTEAAAPEEGATSETESTTKTLLSGDEGDGSSEGGEAAAAEELSWTPPDGFTLNEAQQQQLDDFTAFAKEQGLSNEQFNKVIEYEMQRGVAAVEQMGAQWKAQIESWGAATQADSELGGDAMAENLSIASGALDAVATPEMRALLNAPSAENPTGLGLGNHPEVIRLFYRVGRAMQDQGFVFSGGSPAGGSPEERMYPTMQGPAS